MVVTCWYRWFLGMMIVGEDDAAGWLKTVSVGEEGDPCWLVRRRRGMVGEDGGCLLVRRM